MTPKSSPTAAALPARAAFPPGFVFGTATSAYQVEGHAFGGAGPTHWDTFAATPGNVAHGDNGAIACDHYHRWAEDLDLIQGGNFDAYRFSASWARVLPEGRGRPNPEGLDFYDRLVDGLLERGLKPMLTLYHWELPSALADRGGWANRDTAAALADFATLIVGRLGDRLWSVAPINEPWCVSWLSHFLGAHAPGLRDIRAAARAMHHVGLGHGLAIQALRALGQQGLGAVINLEPALPADDSAEARAATDRFDAIMNRFFLSGIFRGTYPQTALGALEPHLPPRWQDDMALIAQPLDWAGINYYTRKIIAPASGPASGPAGGLWPAFIEVEGPLPRTEMGWEIWPEGLTAALTRVARHYTGDLPLYVTENGMAAPDRTRPAPGAPIEDQDRIAYFSAHLQAARQAIAEGVPLKGYFLWSLMDNFEWALGYDKRFGIVEVDFETLERRPKASYHALARALARES